MNLNKKAESFFQNSLSKFCTNRKPDDEGFVSSGFEREMFRGGFELAVKMLKDYGYEGEADAIVNGLEDLE